MFDNSSQMLPEIAETKNVWMIYRREEHEGKSKNEVENQSTPYSLESTHHEGGKLRKRQRSQLSFGQGAFQF